MALYNHTEDPTTQRAPISDLLQDIGLGKVAGHTAVNKFGHNPTVGNAAAEETWDGSAAYEYAAAASLMWISSSDETNDVGLTYSVQGIDADGALATIEATLHAVDARTMVPVLSGGTDDKWLRIFRVHATSATAATGDIYVSKDNTDVGGDGIPDTATDIQAKIVIGNEQTLMTMFTVPTGKTGHLLGWEVSTSTAQVVTCELFVRENGKTFRIKGSMVINAAGGEHVFRLPLEIPALADVKVMAQAGAASAAVSASFDLYYA